MTPEAFAIDPPRQTFVSLKAYGDFVIACSATRGRAVDSRSSPSLLAGEHVRQLADALEVTHVRFVGNDGNHEVPAAFDIRKRGWVQAALSLVRLRRQVASTPSLGEVVFDHVGWRERFIAGRLKHRALPHANNIYSAYASAMGENGHALEATRGTAHRTIRSAVIVPASRIDAKTLPSPTIEMLARHLTSRGISVEVVLLEGEVVPLARGVSVRRIPRRFRALVDDLRSFDLVVSADSLAAHMAEYLGVHCFVVGPKPNTYWLPSSCFRTDAWALFGDEARLGEWLDRGGL